MYIRRFYNELFYPIKNDKYIDVKELKEIKYSYLHAEKVTSITEDNLDRLKFMMQQIIFLSVKQQ